MKEGKVSEPLDEKQYINQVKCKLYANLETYLNHCLANENQLLYN